MQKITTVDPRIETALANIDRGTFIQCERESLVAGQSIPSADTLRQIFSVIDFPPEPKILQVGAGLGYACAILSGVAKEVIAIENEASLVEAAIEKIRALKLNNIVFRQGDGTQGAPDQKPFDVIVVATAKVEDKSALLKQLTPNGQLICLERAEASQLKLVKYNNDGHRNYTRSEHGFIDFRRNKGEILIELGLVTDSILNEARVSANAKKVPVIDEVRRLSNVNDMELYRSMAAQYGLQLGDINELIKRIDPAIFASCSKAFLDYHRLIPLYKTGDSLLVATNNPDSSVVEMQKAFPKQKIQKILVTPTDFRRLWSAIDLCLKNQSGMLSASLLKNIHPEEDSNDLLEKDKPKTEAYLISIFEALLLDAVAERASDIHIEQYHNEVRLRLRVDGELRDLTHYNISPREQRGLVNVIKLRSELNIAERRLPQGGRSRLRVGDAAYDLRVQVQPSLHAEHVVIRLLPQNTELISIDKLGLSPLIASNYKRLLRNPAGLVLVVGPTGSGKSTTLYAGLQLLAADGTRKVITVEDPVEYSINNIQQTRVRPEIGFNFADAMRSFVRQDPDVILVGEIRDHETALEAIRASQTGHVVLSTLHCNDAVDAMQRLYDLGVHPNSLASELLAVVAQRLAKRICSHCRVEDIPDEHILKELFPTGTPDSFKAYIGKGCAHCHGTGSYGRVGVVEYLQINPDVRNAISKQLAIGDLRKLALDAGLITMRDSALDHVIQGNIPLSELPRILPAERMAPEARWQWEKS